MDMPTDPDDIWDKAQHYAYVEILEMLTADHGGRTEAYENTVVYLRGQTYDPHGVYDD